MNNPFEKRRITPSYAWWKDAFSKTQLDDFEKLCEKYELHDGTVVSGSDDETPDTTVRISKVHFFDKSDETSWIFDTFNNVAKNINDQFYQFDLYGYSQFQYTTYFGSEKGKYDWHMDSILDGTMSDNMKIQDTRKLTLVMLLNDRNEFTGGDFQLNMGQENNPMTIPMERGMIVAFPGFIIHRVTPVLSGVRKSIVIWVEGPKFR